jgi:molybdopterin-guanine dinucleotide biosynthesis protein A
MTALGGVILAGGRSRRMGQDKSLMRLEGQPLLARVFSALSPICSSIVLVTNTPERHASLGVRMVPDAYPGAGSLGGILTGLQAVQSEMAAVVACDLPFLNGTLLERLAALAEGYDAVVPDLSPIAHTETGETAKQLDLHPLHAIYRRSCIGPIEERVRSGDLRVIGFFRHVRVRYMHREEAEAIDPGLRSFINVNTPEEWAQAERLAQDARDEALRGGRAVRQ